MRVTMANGKIVVTLNSDIMGTLVLYYAQTNQEWSLESATLDNEGIDTDDVMVKFRIA